MNGYIVPHPTTLKDLLQTDVDRETTQMHRSIDTNTKENRQ